MSIDRLELLKIDLQYPTVEDDYLTHLLGAAEELIQREGILLTDSVEDEHLRITYAAFLYRKRAQDNPIMPRSLRWALNNRLMGQKGGSDVV